MHCRMPEREHVGGMAAFLTLRRMNIILRDSVERGNGGALSCAPSADAVAGNGRPLNWVSGGSGTGRPKPSAHAVAGKDVSMAMKTITVPLPDDQAEPAWEVALLLPAQGEWSEDDYLWLTDHTRCLVELTDGHIEVLALSSWRRSACVYVLVGTVSRTCCYCYPPTTPAAAIGTGLVLTSWWKWS